MSLSFEKLTVLNLPLGSISLESGKTQTDKMASPGECLSLQLSAMVPKQFSFSDFRIDFVIIISLLVCLW